MANPIKCNTLHLEGKQFGEWTVLEYVGTDTKHYRKYSLWKCKCSCGKIQTIKGQFLTRGDTKSCRNCATSKYAGTHPLPFGEAAFNSLYYNYKSRAKRFDMPFNLTKMFFRKLTKQNCYYCGNEPNQIIQQPNQNGYYQYSGIDRLDNTKGYTVDNCVSCCKICNYMKKAYSVNDFYAHIKSIYENLRSKNGE